jgi:hypothetical protein
VVAVVVPTVVPYAVVVPKDKNELETSSVVHEMVAVVKVVDEASEVIKGGVTSGPLAVVKVKSLEVA